MEGGAASSVVVRPGVLVEPEAQRLIGELNAETLAKYPEPGATHFRLDDHEVAPGAGVFLLAYLDGEAVACGAIRRLDAASMEIKRMYVQPKARGRGISRRILEELEREAIRLGATRVLLETGARHLEAMGLYRSSGYVPTAPFGEYVDSPLSVCLEKRLTPRI